MLRKCMWKHVVGTESSLDRIDHPLLPRGKLVPFTQAVVVSKARTIMNPPVQPQMTCLSLHKGAVVGERRPQRVAAVRLVLGGERERGREMRAAHTHTHTHTHIMNLLDGCSTPDRAAASPAGADLDNSECSIGNHLLHPFPHRDTHTESVREHKRYFLLCIGTETDK